MTDDFEFEELATRVEFSDAFQVRLATKWRSVPAFFGTGTVLVGPAKDSENTVAIVPPGVWGRNPESDSHPTSREGWRRVTWAPRRLVDEHRPIKAEVLRMAEVAEFLEPFPDALLWMRQVVESQLKLLRSLAQGLDAWADHIRRFEDLQRAAAVVFGTQGPGPVPRVEDLGEDWPEASRVLPSPHFELDSELDIATEALDTVFEVGIDPDDRLTLEVAAAEIVGSTNAITEAQRFVLEAQIQARSLSEDLLQILLRFRQSGNDRGALLLRGVPVGQVPETPTEVDRCVGAGLPAAASLAVIAGVLGDQYGFEREHGGSMVQDILPVRGFEDSQRTISSHAPLSAHVEKAFIEDDNRPDFVLLLCLRPDHHNVARTKLSSWKRVVNQVDPSTLELLRQPLFETAIDESFAPRTAGGEVTRKPIRVLDEAREPPRVRADFAETQGTVDDAQEALKRLEDVVNEVAIDVALQTGDLLIIDNRSTFVGRSSFTPEWDGRDRWLLRTFVTADLTRGTGVRERIVAASETAAGA
jgi:L-asparagine oxygenase